MAERDPRDTALLTQAQRGLLRGEKSYSQRAERQMRSRIRNRLYNGIVDLSLLRQKLTIEEIDQAFADPPEKISESSGPPGTGRAGGAMTKIFEIAYLLYRDIEQKGDPPEGWRTEMGVQNAINSVLIDLGVDADVSVDIEVTRRDDGFAALAQSTDDLSELSITQLTGLFKNGHITAEEHTAALRQITNDEE
jgi:hypothetical protein